MSISQQNQEPNSFIAGLNTDASPLNAPANTSSDEQNMVMVSDGTRARRYGYEREFFGFPQDWSANYGATHERSTRSYLWDYPTIDNKKMIVVVENGDTIQLFSAESNNLFFPYNFSIDPFILGATFAVLPDVKERRSCHKQSAFWGSEFYLPRGGDIHGFKYASNSNNISLISTQKLAYRDLWGEDDGGGILSRPTTLSGNHAYNLMNQGWTKDQVEAWRLVMTPAYPSNGDLPWFGIDPATGLYDANLLTDIPAKSGAPKGAVTLLLGLEASSKSSQLFVWDGVGATFPAEDQKLNLDNIVMHSGRAFWSVGRDDQRVESTNSRAPDLGTMIFFSQPITSGLGEGEGLPSCNNCTSVLSPTDENFTGTVADGGFISLPDAGRVQGMASLNDGIYVIADNGIWLIRSANGIFTPQQAVVEKITSTGCVSGASIIVARESLFYMSSEGIVMVSYSPEAERAVPSMLTEGRIENLVSKFSRGCYSAVYDPSQGHLKWLCLKETLNNLGRSENDCVEIIFDLRLNSFSKNTLGELNFSTNDFKIETGVTSPLCYAEVPKRFDSVIFTKDIETEVDRTRSQFQHKVIFSDSAVLGGWLVGDQHNVDFEDFGTDVPSFLVTQLYTGADTQRRKQFGYVTTNFNLTELSVTENGEGAITVENPGGCLMSGRFDFSNSATSGKWGSTQQAYRLVRNYIPDGSSDTFDYGQSVITTKNKVRGRGRSLQLKFESEAGKDIQLIGWGLTAYLGTGV